MRILGILTGAIMCLVGVYLTYIGTPFKRAAMDKPPTTNLTRPILKLEIPEFKDLRRIVVFDGEKAILDIKKERATWKNILSFDPASKNQDYEQIIQQIYSLDIYEKISDTEIIDLGLDPPKFRFMFYTENERMILDAGQPGNIKNSRWVRINGRKDGFLVNDAFDNFFKASTLISDKRYQTGLNPDDISGYVLTRGAKTLSAKRDSDNSWHIIESAGINKLSQSDLNLIAFDLAGLRFFPAEMEKFEPKLEIKIYPKSGPEIIIFSGRAKNGIIPVRVSNREGSYHVELKDLPAFPLDLVP